MARLEEDRSYRRPPPGPFQHGATLDHFGRKRGRTDIRVVDRGTIGTRLTQSGHSPRAAAALQQGVHTLKFDADGLSSRKRMK
jgi:hypothetical protein